MEFILFYLKLINKKFTNVWSFFNLEFILFLIIFLVQFIISAILLINLYLLIAATLHFILFLLWVYVKFFVGPIVTIIFIYFTSTYVIIDFIAWKSLEAIGIWSQTIYNICRSPIVQYFVILISNTELFNFLYSKFLHLPWLALKAQLVYFFGPDIIEGMNNLHIYLINVFKDKYDVDKIRVKLECFTLWRDLLFFHFEFNLEWGRFKLIWYSLYKALFLFLLKTTHKVLFCILSIAFKIYMFLLFILFFKKILNIFLNILSEYFPSLKFFQFINYNFFDYYLPFTDFYCNLNYYKKIYNNSILNKQLLIFNSSKYYNLVWGDLIWTWQRLLNIKTFLKFGLYEKNTDQYDWYQKNKHLLYFK